MCSHACLLDQLIPKNYKKHLAKVLSFVYVQNNCNKPRNGPFLVENVATVHEAQYNQVVQKKHLPT